jgi:ankyrin repeat protein
MNQLQDIVNKENAKLISESIYSSDVADERKCDLDKSLGEAKKNRKANGLIRFLQQDNQNFEMTLKESLSEFCSYDEFKIFVKEACRLTWEKGLFFCQQFFTVNKAIILKEMADHNDIIFCADIFNCVPLKDRHQWIIEQCGAFPEMLSYYLFSLMDVDCPQDNANELMMLLKNEAWKFDAKMVVAPNETSLYEYAIERFLFSVADELVKRGVFSNQSDDFLEKILNRIINTCHLGALEEWLKRYPKYINLIKANEKIYLMAKLFAERGNTVMVKKLMGVNVNLNECKQYPMTSEWMVALEPDTLKLLLDAKANPNIQNNEGKTPLHLSRNPGIIRTLLDAKGSFYTKDKHGETPVFTAAKLSAKTSSLNVLKVLLDAKADPNNSDHQDKLPLILWAIKNKSLNLFNLLLASKANVNVEDKDGLTPLMVAINHYEPFYHNLMEWIEPLLESKANVNVVDKNGETPLTLAMRIVDFDEESNQVPKFRPLLLDEEATGEKIVKVLLNAKADIHVKNNKGETPLQLTSHFFAHIHQDWFKSLLDLRDNLDNIEMLINDITDVIIQYNKSKLLDSKENLMTINVGVIQDINLKKAIILYQHCHQHLDTTRSQVSHYMRRRSLYDCQSTFSKIEDEFKMLIDEVFSLVNEKESIISSFGRLFSGEKLLSDLMKEMLIKKYPAFYTEKSLDSLKQDVVAILRKPGANSQ